MVGDTGRAVFVGDRNQAIYGFAGADSESMDCIKREFACRELPLSITYRCGTRIVKLAQEFVPGIEAAPDAHEGEVVQHGNVRSIKPDQWSPADLLVCRNSAPLIKVAYWLVGQRVKIRVQGSDIADGMLSTIRKVGFGCTSIDQFESKLHAWYNKGMDKLRASDDDEAEAKMGSLNDSYSAVIAVLDAVQTDTVEGLVAAIRGLFVEKNEGVTLSTIHKAKGLEADTVWVLDWDLLPSKSAKQDWQLEQEKNLQYIAVTRARKSLRFIASP
jgi:superfamily I DNA/RNA helicase